MNRYLNLLALTFDEWLKRNASRIAGRFEVEPLADWSKGDRQGIAIDLRNDQVHGRVTAWPQHMAVAEWPFADAEILDADTGEIVFIESFVEFNNDLLDRWFAALESFSGSTPQA